MTDAKPRPSGAGRSGFASTFGDPLTATLWLVGALAALRVAVLFATPLELYPDEAQYWLWSRKLAWGYFSKPPIIAWVIRATTAIGGDGEAWVRLSAPLLHAVAALALQRAGTRLRDGWTGFRAAAIYSLMPGVQLSSGVIATDTPLLAFLALALWGLGALWTAPPRGGAKAALAFGAALGLACLSKYAGLYTVLGLAAHALMDAQGRRRLWTGRRLGVAAAAFALFVAPNIAWNLANHLQTVSHTVADAGLSDSAPVGGLDPRGPLGFVLGQFGVFGPVAFAVLLFGAARAAGRRREDAVSRLMLALTAPALLVVLGEAMLVRANANWAAAAYAPGSLLIAGWMAGAGGRRTFALLAGVQAAAAAAIAVVMVSPAAAAALHMDNGLKRARGWSASADLVRAYLAQARASAPVTAPVTALAVDDRFMFNALAYYGRDWIAAPGAPPLRMWVHENRALNQAEAAAPLLTTQGARVVVVSTTWPQQTRWDFQRTFDARTEAAPLDARRSREILLYVGEGFAPRPRDPKTGLPIAP